MEGFYVGLLGYRVEWRPDADNVYLTNGQDSLALHRDMTQGEGSRLDHFGVLVEGPEDVDRWAQYLEARGANVVAAPRTHRDGCRSCYVADPEDNRLQFLFHPALSQKA
jgi:catechol 2,3-dioxygenase-like lactoylglutathione lyase family enzyme